MNLNKEWNFITRETHKNFNKSDLIKREILLCLQILLSKLELKNYLALKRIYASYLKD